MIKIGYPDENPSVKTVDGKEYIFCIVRKKWVMLTPEEWVRQNFLLYLTVMLQYPLSLVAVEKQVSLGEVNKRFDIVLYDNDARANILVECKEMNVPLNEKVLSQVLRYNSQVQANYLVVTNGSYCMAFALHQNRFEPLPNLPSFK